MKTFIALPCMDKVDTPHYVSMLKLFSQLKGEITFSVTNCTLIYDARNILAQKAVASGCDRILWLDSDIVFDPDVIDRLSAHIDSGKDFISGLYFGRKNPIMMTLFKELEYKRLEGSDNQVVPIAEPYEDYPRDSVFEIAAAGFGCCMVKTELVRRVAQKYGLPFAPLIGFGEDLSFCKRATELGAKLYCDSSIKVRHIGSTEITEETWDARKK